MTQKNQQMQTLSGHYSYARLFRSTLPCVIMLVVTSIYSVVDGLFVSNFVGKTPFTAVNFIFPLLMILGGVGFMFGTGGGALIAKTLGEQQQERADDIFSMTVYVAAGCGVVLMILGLAFLRPVAVAMGAQGQLLDDSLIYGGVYLLGLPGCVLQYAFQNLCATAGKPKLGLYVTVAAGVTNIVLDALFVAVFSWGLAGAAAASALSQYIGGIVPLAYFLCRNSSLLRLKKCRLDPKALLKICTNGSSELLNNISMSIVNILYNVQLLHYVGEDGIAAYGVLMYVNLIFLSIFIGYSVGTAPVISYHYGAQNHRELRSLLGKSLVILSVSAVLMFLLSEFLARPLSVMFTGYDPGLLELTLRGFFLYSFSFLFSGFAIFGSSFFTALNDGLTSAVISFLRTLVFQIVAVLVLPLVWGVDGIWLSIVAAELLAAAVALALIAGKKRRYHY